MKWKKRWKPWASKQRLSNLTTQSHRWIKTVTVITFVTKVSRDIFKDFWPFRVTRLINSLSGLNGETIDSWSKSFKKFNFFIGDGCIDFDEFCTVIAEAYYQPVSTSDLEKSFKFFDKGNLYRRNPIVRRWLVICFWISDGSGFITESELLSIVAKLKPNVSVDEIRRFIQRIDTNSDGSISFEGNSP